MQVYDFFFAFKRPSCHSNVRLKYIYTHTHIRIYTSTATCLTTYSICGALLPFFRSFLHRIGWFEDALARSLALLFLLFCAISLLSPMCAWLLLLFWFRKHISYAQQRTIFALLLPSHHRTSLTERSSRRATTRPFTTTTTFISLSTFSPIHRYYL